MTSELKALADAGCKFVRLAAGEKRPVGAAWQTRATSGLTYVNRWLDAGDNVGLLLGPESGVIDVEFDEWPGVDTLGELGLLDVRTPTWKSARGEHRLYRWEPWMPDAAFLKAGPIEIRLGGRAAQSVLPPSRHPSGVVYEWITSPVGVEIATVPEQLFPFAVCMR